MTTTQPFFTNNHTPGRNGHTPDIIVIHIMQGSIEATDAWFHDPYSQVSAHYGIAKNGTIHHYVHESDTAWHAGVIRDPAPGIIITVNPNLHTIGIEHEGFCDDIWPQEQLFASAQLIVEIAQRWNIPIDRSHIIGHYEIDSVDRPYCPAIDKSIIDQLVTLAQQLKVEQNQQSQ